MVDEIRIIIGIVALILLLISVFGLDFQDLTSSKNKPEYLNIVAMSLLCISMYFSDKSEKSKKNKSK